jgi:hypothetical protein
LVLQIEGVGTLLDMKQQTRAPAELAGLVPRDPRPTGCRAADDEIQLTGGACSTGWCESDGLSFTVGPLSLEPTPRESRKDRWLDPVEAARAWATRTAATHRWVGDRNLLASRLTADLEQKLVSLSVEYLSQLELDFHTFRDDPRVIQDRAAADTAAQRWLEEDNLASPTPDAIGVQQ